MIQRRLFHIGAVLFWVEDQHGADVDYGAAWDGRGGDDGSACEKEGEVCELLSFGRNAWCGGSMLMLVPRYLLAC